MQNDKGLERKREGQPAKPAGSASGACPLSARERGRGENYAGGSNEITVTFGKKHNLSVYDPTAGTDVIQTVRRSDKISLTMTNKPYIIQLKK